MLKAITDQACTIPFYELPATEGESLLCVTWPCYQNANGQICNPNLTPTRGCVPPYYLTSDPGVFTDYKGNCNPEFSPDSYFTVQPTPGKRPSTGLKFDTTTIALIGAAFVLMVALGSGRR